MSQLRIFKKKSQASPSSVRPLQTGAQARRKYEHSEILKATENFSNSLIIGSGGFGNVFKGKLPDGVDVAVKRLDPKSNHGENAFWSEVQTLHTLRHRNLVSLIGYCNYEKKAKNWRVWNHDSVSDSKKEMILLYEYMPNGSVKSLLHKLGTYVYISFLQRLTILMDVGNGLIYLHDGTENGTIHQDIKSSNILLDKRGVAKISDYGLLKMGQQDGSPSTVSIHAKGSFGYIDPAYYTSGILSRKSDVYSFGVLLLELLTRKPAVVRCVDNQQDLVTWVQESIKECDLMSIVDPEVRDEISLDFLNVYLGIAQDCLLKHPNERPKMSEVVPRIAALHKWLHPAESDGLKDYTFSDLLKATGRFRSGLSIGEGSDVKVFLGWVHQNTLTPSNHIHGIAVAVVRVTSPTEWSEEIFLGQLTHPNIIKLLGWCTHGHEKWLVYEHMKNSLSHFIHGDESLSWRKRLHILIGVAHALIYLYTEKNVLCHFKCDGILVDEKFNAKIGSFGWAKRNYVTEGKCDRIWLDGVFGYLKRDYDTRPGRVMMKDDICSFGLVLFETITGKFGNDLEILLKSLECATEKRKMLNVIMDPRLEANYPKEGAFECVKLALRCVAKQHEDKPSREDILKRLKEIDDLHKTF